MKGKNIIVGQSGGPTAVINASLAGIFSKAKELGADKIYGMLNGIQGFLEGRYVDISRSIKDENDVNLLKHTPAAFLGSCRFKLPSPEGNEAIYESIFALLEKLDIHAFFYIGGNDSMDSISKLSEYAKRISSDVLFIGVPKTVDNDLVHTDHSPGFGSAAKYIATSMKELIRDNKVNDQDVVTIVEIMGRDAGWLTGSSILSKCDDCSGPDLIYLPEVPFEVDSFLSDIRETQKTNRAVIVAVSEGIKTADGKYVCDTVSAARSVDSFGHTQLTGTARALADLVAEVIGCKVRAIEFSSLQRCAGHIISLTDLEEAFLVGSEAVKAAAEGYNAKFIQLNRISDIPYICETAICDVALVANLKKDVPLDWINEKKNYVTKEFINYVKPLIMGEVNIQYENGIPKHIPDVIKEI